MQTVIDMINAILAALGMTPVQALAVAFNAVMGAISVPITSWLKTKLAGIPFLATEPLQEKISGWATILVSGIIGILLMLVGDWLFGLKILAEDGVFTTVVAAFGINQTFASIFFEWNKTRKAKLP